MRRMSVRALSMSSSSSRYIGRQTRIQNVAVVGGTHGNELAGVYIVKKLNKETESPWKGVSVKALVSNKAAVKVNRRYVECDMNRCFKIENLQDANAAKVEESRAKELNAILGPKSSSNPLTDLILDLHNTTSNTGTLLCFHEDDLFSLELAAFLHTLDDSIRAAFWPQGDQPFLPTVARSGMTVEVGPVCHGTVDARIYAKMQFLVGSALKYVERRNEQLEGDHGRAVNLPVATRIGSVPYPRDENGELVAFVHPSLQGLAELQEGSTLKEGDPMFKTLSGDDILFHCKDFGLELSDAERGIYPMFVNEAAYYEKDMAFILTTVASREVLIHNTEL